MPDAVNPSHSPSPEPKPTRGQGGLVAILIGIVLGVLVGVFYGRAMWVASGGPERRLAELEEILEQKQETLAAARAEDRAEDAERYARHVATIEEEIAEVNAAIAARAAAGGPSAVAAAAWEIVKFMGDLFLQVLKLLVIPLVVTSMICGITAMGDVRRLGRVGGATIFYYMMTTTIAVLIGIILVETIRPGQAADDTFTYTAERVAAQQDASALETLLNVVRGQPGDPGSGMFPENIFLAASQTNVLALIVFALVFGGALTTVGEKGQAAIGFFDAANDAVMKMVHLVMWFAPLGIFGLVAMNIARNGGGAAFYDELRRLGWYVATVLLGLGLHGLVLMGVVMIFAGRNPLLYLYGMLRALLTAVSTSSSSATLPVTMECVEENNGVSNRAASFVCPLGAQVNMDGTALYEAVAVIFIAQTLAIELSLGKLVAIFLTATLAAIGAAGIPEAGLVTMVSADRQSEHRQVDAV
jgi:Na+/H+-dicarboxylate symporter